MKIKHLKILFVILLTFVCYQQINSNEISNMQESFIPFSQNDLINPENIKNIISQYKNILLIFYDPNCGVSQQILSEFEKAAGVLIVLDKFLGLAKIDGINYKNLSEIYSIKSLPTILHISDGEIIPYTGGNTTNEIIFFTKNLFKEFYSTEIKNNALVVSSSPGKKEWENFIINNSKSCELPKDDSSIKRDDLNKLTEPYRNVNLLSVNSFSLIDDNNLKSLISIIEKYKPKKILEVGSWMGKSTIYLSENLPSDGEVYSVDTWNYSIPNFDRKIILERLYDQFLSNVIHAGLTEKIKPLKMTNRAAAKFLSQSEEKFDMIFLNFAYDKESIKQDIELFYPLLKEDGLLAGNMYSWNNYSIGHAIIESMKGKKLVTNGVIWYFRDNLI